MKFNWGTGLAIFIIAFIGTLVFILYKSTQYSESLVVKNYYEEDLAYQEVMVKKQNTADLPAQVKLNYLKEKQQIEIVFPSDHTNDIQGSVLIFSPISEKLDVKHEFNIGQDSIFSIPVSELNNGKYRIKLDWNRAGKKYYQEEVIVI